MNTLARKTVNGAAVNIFVTVSKTVLQFVIILPILARALPPSDFGLVGMAMAFVTFFTMFNDLGISAALVRADKPSAAFWSTAFWTNVVIGVLLTFAAYSAAPYIAGFFSEPIVEPLVRALSLVLFMHCVFLVPMAWLQRNFRFTTIALIDLFATLVSAVVAIWAALSGYGVWALIWQQLTMYLLKAIGGLLTHRAPLRLTYQIATIIRVLPFSLGLTGTAFVGFISRNSDNILIGRYMGADALGFYGRAYQIMLMPVQSLAQGANFALYPAMSELKNEPTVLGRVFLKAVSVLSALTIPMMTGVAIVAVPFIDLMFGPKWGAIAPILQPLAFVGIIQSLTATSTVTLKALGRADIMLRWSLIRMVVFLGTFMAGIYFGTLPLLALAYLIANMILYVPFQVETLKHVSISVSEFWASIAPQVLSTVVMAACLLAVKFGLPGLNDWPSYLQLLVLVPVGIIAYALAMWVLFRRFVDQLISEARTLFLKKPTS